MSELENKTVEILDKFDALATQYTPAVIDGAVTAVQVTAIGDLARGIFGLACAFATWWLSKNFSQYARKEKTDDYMSDWEIGIAIGMGAGILSSGIIAVTSVALLFDIWNWVAIWNPELATAHRVLGL